MVIAPQQAWKIVLAIVLLVAIFLSACAHAPKQPIARNELRQLVLSALGLYAVGLLASLTHHGQLAGIVYAAGIVVCALAVWLSRGIDPGDPPDEPDEPVDEQPPPEPNGVPTFDWSSFERQFRDYSDRPREPAV
ncbi:MAG TPA: hypothetical protein VG223_08060 [Solirubrobacteraceae bacterium]|jgi:hypothetical protein|nr:hypothetical protein [Solirubrobacteraceae bacterium]